MLWRKSAFARRKRRLRRELVRLWSRAAVGCVNRIMTDAQNVMELDLTRGKLMDMERRLYSIEAELLKKNETIRALESKNADLQNELEDCGKGKQAQVEERLEYPPGRV